MFEGQDPSVKVIVIKNCFAGLPDLTSVSVHSVIPVIKFYLIFHYFRNQIIGTSTPTIFFFTFIFKLYFKLLFVVKISADGSSISSVQDLPIAPVKAQLVYDAKFTGAGKAWIWDVAIDKVRLQDRLGYIYST